MLFRVSCLASPLLVLLDRSAQVPLPVLHPHNHFYLRILSQQMAIFGSSCTRSICLLSSCDSLTSLPFLHTFP
ncbi:hypothetical protein M432DRAFT_614613 [Thermoascus aurantiacus ATCC 26904]